MILQALYEYYERKASDPESNIAPVGFEWKELPFLIVITSNGKVTRLEDTREKKSNKLRGKRFLLPQSSGRPGKNAWQTAFLLWDHFGYVLGYPKENTQKAKETAEKQMDTFTKTLRALPDEVKQDEGVNAVLQFYEKQEYKNVFELDGWSECSNISGCNLSFKLEGSDEIVPERQVVQQYQKKMSLAPAEKEQWQANCLITGEKGIIQLLHTSTAILGGQATGKLVGFQKNCGFDSYGKEQGYNAPVSKYAESAYTTALNTLLKGENKIMVGDTSVVFWSEKKNQFEKDFGFFFSNSPKDDPERGAKAVRQLYESVASGKFVEDTQNSFYILGLSPNSARISVRFWQQGTVEQIGRRIKQHFDDLEIVKAKNEEEFFPLIRLLAHISLRYEIANLPANLAGALVQSVLSGGPYPITLLQQCIRRIRAEQHVTRIRAAVLKAYLNRAGRFKGNPAKKEITMSLDKNNTEIAYRTGRLFAVLERIQESAQPGINSTIRDRFYGAASSTPVTVFPRLLKLKNHHLAKIPNKKVFFESLLGEIFDGMGELPRNLSLEDQARFAIGYYHQRQDFFKKKNTEQSLKKEV